MQIVSYFKKTMMIGNTHLHTTIHTVKSGFKNFPYAADTDFPAIWKQKNMTNQMVTMSIIFSCAGISGKELNSLMLKWGKDTCQPP